MSTEYGIPNQVKSQARKEKKKKSKNASVLEVIIYS